MNATAAVFRRELAGYFHTPIAYVFGIVFLFLAGICTFYPGGFFARGEADLKSFFNFLPWLYLFLMPAISMRLWAEERRSGAVELLLTLPMPLFASVLGKFLAAWSFTVIVLGLTVPLWITVSWLGEPDHGVILVSYAGTALMAGGYLSIGACISAATRNQVIAFAVSVVVCFLFTVSGSSIVLDFFTGWVPRPLLDTIASFSFLTHFASMTEGIVDARDVVYFGSLIAFWLYANLFVVDRNKAG